MFKNFNTYKNLNESNMLDSINETIEIEKLSNWVKDSRFLIFNKKKNSVQLYLKPEFRTIIFDSEKKTHMNKNTNKPYPFSYDISKLKHDFFEYVNKSNGTNITYDEYKENSKSKMYLKTPFIKNDLMSKFFFKIYPELKININGKDYAYCPSCGRVFTNGELFGSDTEQETQIPINTKNNILTQSSKNIGKGNCNIDCIAINGKNEGTEKKLISVKE